ncbi:hypothetical protein [Nocardioides litoris]|uniref:hypothetical protein n=1 Tax=Nocardioides litoris TaxID=1926648 RepID=UPI0011201B60|nr:hypothetical protein [Nocardioides litoris]
MDPAPRDLVDLPRDPELGLPVPFMCGTEGFGGARDGSPPTLRRLDGRRVTQCALSRVCGVCGSTLGRPVAFVGTEIEQARNAFHAAPLHVACADSLRGWLDGLDGPLIGQDAADVAASAWVTVTTSGFEFVRASSEDLDRRPTFQPNSLST